MENNFLRGLKSNPHVMVWGGYGGGNVGDYITLDQAIKTINATCDNPQISILDFINPTLTQGLFPTIPVLTQPELIYDKTNPITQTRYHIARQLAKNTSQYKILSVFRPTVIKKLKQADLLYCVGGGYLNDLYNLDFFISPVEWANALDVPVATAPVGLGPFNLPASKKRFINAFSQTNLVVRDEESARLIAPDIIATVAADDGFIWAKQLPASPLQNTFPQPKMALKIAVCPLISQECDQADQFTHWWKSIIRQLDEQLTIEWIPFSFDYRPYLEADLMRSIWPDTPVISPTDTDFTRPVRAIQQADVVFTGRFHATVMANALDKPCMSVYSSDYYRSKLEPLAIPDQCWVSHFSTLTLSDVIKQFDAVLKPPMYAPLAR